MKRSQRIAIGVALSLVVVALGGVGTAAAHGGNDSPDHPACTGDKYKISSEGTNDGAASGSQWWVKPVCSDEAGGPDHRHDHTGDDDLSVPESTIEECHDTAREKSPRFEQDSC